MASSARSVEARRLAGRVEDRDFVQAFGTELETPAGREPKRMAAIERPLQGWGSGSERTAWAALESGPVDLLQGPADALPPPECTETPLLVCGQRASGTGGKFGRLSEQLVDHASMHVGKPEVASHVTVGQLLVIEPEQV